MLKVRDQKGFTLIELLIVIAIIAILAAIAIPQFAEYRAKALEAGMMTDARNAATVMESIFSDCQDYTTAVTNGGPGPVVANITGSGGAQCAATNVVQTVRVSAANTLTIPAFTASTYTVQVNNPNARAGRLNVSIDQAGNISWF